MKKLALLKSTISNLFHNKSIISSVASLKGYLQKRNFEYLSVSEKYNSNENKLKPWGSLEKISGPNNNLMSSRLPELEVNQSNRQTKNLNYNSKNSAKLKQSHIQTTKIIKSSVAALNLLNKILILIFLILLTFLILYYLYQFFYNTEFDILEAISNLFKLLASGLTYNLFFLNNSSTNLNNSNNTFSSNINKDICNLSTGANNTGNNPSNSQGSTPSNNSSDDLSLNPSNNSSSINLNQDLKAEDYNANINYSNIHKFGGLAIASSSYTENPIIITKDNDQYIANWGSFKIPVSKKVGNYYINNATLKSFNDEKLLREFLKKVP